MGRYHQFHFHHQKSQQRSSMLQREKCRLNPTILYVSVSQAYPTGRRRFYTLMSIIGVTTLLCTLAFFIYLRKTSKQSGH